MAQELSDKAKSLLFEIRYAVEQAGEFGSSFMKLAKEAIEEEAVRIKKDKEKRAAEAAAMAKGKKEKFEADYKAWKAAKNTSD